MIQCQLKLRMCKSQERECERWLFHLASVWNWGVRKIELNAKDKIYFTEKQFHNLLAGHSERLGISSHTLQGVLRDVHASWRRCFKGLSKKPHLKGVRNRMNSIPFPDPINPAKGNRIILPSIGSVRFFKQNLPEGRIKCARIVRRSSGWYLCLFVDAELRPIERVAAGVVGIDPGFRELLTLSDGEIIDCPQEARILARRLAQSQKGHNKKLTARIHERIGNQRKDRNHKLSRQLVSENIFIAFSKDNHRAVAKRFGKSVANASHGQLRQMLAYKSRLGGTQYVEVGSHNSTRACSTCGALSGPAGLAGLKVRQWRCPCGAEHERDVNAARNALIAGAGLALERSLAHAR